MKLNPKDVNDFLNSKDDNLSDDELAKTHKKPELDLGARIQKIRTPELLEKKASKAIYKSRDSRK